MSEGKQVLALVAFSFVVLIVLAGRLIWRPAGRAEVLASSEPAAEPAAAGKVVATVNGEPIFESELMAGLPDDAFQAQLDYLKESKLKRLVEEALQWQFLQDRKVTLSDNEFKKAAADFETMVRTPGCPCCGGGYANVEDFMRVRAVSPRELRRRITCDGGLKLYAARLEQERTSPQAPAETAKKYRAEIEKEQAKTSAEDQMYEELDAWRKRAKIQYSAASAPVKSGTK